MCKILFLSNGYGEDTIAYYILKNLPEVFKIEVFPLVTEGEIFKDYKIRGPVKVFPSRGISGFFNFHNFWLDIKAGLISHVLNQIEFLKSLEQDFYFVAVGDIYPLLLLYLSGKISKTFFVATAKSIKTEFFNILEIFVMKKTIANFVRDYETYEFLKDKLKNVYFVGNPVLDMPFIEYPGNIKENNIIILPGRIDKCLENLKMLLKPMKILSEKGFNFSIIVPAFYPLDNIKEIIKEVDKVVVVDSIYYRFFLENSFCVWGFGGSANEQAAGYGLPVISLYQNNWYRNRQKKLLKDALILVYNVDDFVNQTLKLKEDNEYYRYLSYIGRREMGKLGGAKNIANFIRGIVLNYV